MRVGQPRAVQRLVAVLGSVVGLIALGFASFAFQPPLDTPPERIVVVRVLGVICGVAGAGCLVLMYRTARARMVVSQTELIVHGGFRTRHVPLREVQSIMVGLGGSPAIRFYVLDVRLTSGRAVKLDEARSIAFDKMQAAADAANIEVSRRRDYWRQTSIT
jgi:hypothetical protein